MNIDGKNGTHPIGFSLDQNYPNPFNSNTKIQYVLPEENTVTIILYDIKGSMIRTLINNRQTVGRKSILWNGKNDVGELVPGGIYVYTMTSGNFSSTRKIIFLK